MSDITEDNMETKEVLGTLDDFMRDAINRMIMVAFERMALALRGDPIDVGKVRMIFFLIENQLLSVWASAHKEYFELTEEEQKLAEEQ